MTEQPIMMTNPRYLHRFLRFTLVALLLGACSCARFSNAVADPARQGPFVSEPVPQDGLPKLVDPKPSGSVPHDPEDFTQGLLFAQGHLYESTGRKGQSQLKRIVPDSGEVTARARLADQFFGEGLALYQGKLYQLTWESGVCHLFDQETLEPAGQLYYNTQGWGLTVFDEQLVLSDGSHLLRYFKPQSFILNTTAEVRDGNGDTLPSLNELEMVQGELWANVWMTDHIARIDPQSGKVKGWIQLKQLVQENQTHREGVLNGIAYDPDSDTLWLTGKLWSKIYRFDNVTELFFSETAKLPDSP